jgi:2-keto-4-pentenoate hydratase/2-oxohepta-3-ene-1,7-dioic acid hydratase in catechol pathway
MKLASYAVNGRKTFGIHSEGGFIDLGQRLAGNYDDMKDLLARGDLDKARAFAHDEPDHCETEVCFLPTIDQPGKIFCVGMNYADKRAEFAETNPAPTLFIRFAYSQTGHCRPILKPDPCPHFTWKVENHRA